jgi:hypothetical protein
MASLTTRTRPASRPTPSPTNGRVGEQRVTPAKRRVRLPELAVGVLITVGFALAAVLWQLGSTERVPALAVATPVARGDTITAADVRVAYVAAGDGLVHLDESEIESIVGRVALVDLEAGVLWTPGLVDGGVIVANGDGVVGLSLEPGQFPPGLIVGDEVNVVAPADGGIDEGAAPVVVRGAQVMVIEGSRSDGRTLVSLRAPLADAELVASQAGSGGLRLVLVGQ